MKRETREQNIISMIDTVNQMFNELEDVDDAQDFLVKQKSKIAAFSKSDINNDLQVGDLSNMSDEKIEDYEDVLKRTIKSKWMSAEGREEIWEKQRASLKNRGYDLSKEAFKTFTKVINSAEVQRLIELKVLDSFQVLDYSVDNDESSKLIANVNQLTRNFGQTVHKIKGKTILNILEAMKTVKSFKNITYSEMNTALRELKKYSNITKTTKSVVSKLLVDITKVRRGEIKETDLMKRYK